MTFRDRVRLSFLPLIVLPILLVLVVVTSWTRQSLYTTQAALMESLTRQLVDSVRLRSNLLDRAGLSEDPFFLEQTRQLVYNDASRIAGGDGFFIIRDTRSDTIVYPASAPVTVDELAACPLPSEQEFGWLRTAGNGTFGATCRTDEMMGWEVWYVLPQASILAPVLQLFWLTSIAGLVAMLTGSVVAGYIATRIGAPLRELNLMAEAIGLGDLDYRNAIQRNDEFGTLATSFNSMAERVSNLTNNLETLIEERTQELEATVEDLQHAQDQLVESEKMAYLGKLVADLSHEINTPVGTSITAVTHLQSELLSLRKSFDASDLTKSRLTTFMDHSAELCDSIFASLQRASDLVGTFKKLSVDHLTSQDGEIQVHDYLNGLVLSMKPLLKDGSHKVSLDVPEDLVIHGSPSAFAQIFANLISNAVTHAFEGREGGTMRIRAFVVKNDCWIEFEDDGKGMPEEVASQIFLPFFTTRRNRGGTGLGMHIVYNHVYQTFGGHIRVTSTPGSGTLFHIRIPLEEHHAGTS